MATYFHVAVVYLAVVQGLQAFDYLYEYIPNVVFLNILIFFLVVGYLLEQVAVIGVLHDYASLKSVP